MWFRRKVEGLCIKLISYIYCKVFPHVGTFLLSLSSSQCKRWRNNISSPHLGENPHFPASSAYRGLGKLCPGQSLCKLMLVEKQGFRNVLAGLMASVLTTLELLFSTWRYFFFLKVILSSGCLTCKCSLDCTIACGVVSTSLRCIWWLPSSCW